MTTVGDQELKAKGLSRYSIRGRLGTGGNGVVYDAYDFVLEREVALKIIENTQGQDFIEKARQEAVCAAKIQHPNIILIHDFGVTPDGALVYISMEKLPGFPLREVLEAVSCLTVPEGIAIGISLCSGMQAIHQLGIIHRDIKPANVMLGPAMRVTLLDFGIAKFKRPLKDTTGRFMLQGTPLYMSPEVCRGQVATPLSDLYAVGTVLHTLFLGAHFIYRNNPDAEFEDILRAHIMQPPDSLSEIIPGFPPHLSNIIARAMAKEPAERWPSAQKMGEELASYGRELAEECRVQRLTPTLRDLVALTRAKNSKPPQISLVERTTVRRLPDSMPTQPAAGAPNDSLSPLMKHVTASATAVTFAATPAGQEVPRATVPSVPRARRLAGLPSPQRAPAREDESRVIAPAPVGDARVSQGVARKYALSSLQTAAPGRLLAPLEAVPLARFVQWAVALAIVVAVPLGLFVGRSSSAKSGQASSVVAKPLATSNSAQLPTAEEPGRLLAPVATPPRTSLQPVDGPAPVNDPLPTSAARATLPAPRSVSSPVNSVSAAPRPAMVKSSAAQQATRESKAMPTTPRVSIY